MILYYIFHSLRSISNFGTSDAIHLQRREIL